MAEVSMREHLLKIAVIAAGVLALGAVTAALGQGLTTIHPQGGGMIMYGQVQGQSTEAGAMGYILKNLHQSIGEKPQVGKLFDVKGTDSVATFFNITRRDQGPGKPPLKVSGMLIATKESTDHVEAALVSDDATRFNKTLPSMMKTLMAQWHPMAGAQSAAGSSGGGGAAAPAAQLRTVATQDQSASIGLPAGWQIAANQSGMGTIVASGPNGEWVSLDLTFSATDPNNPAAQRTRQIVASGGLRNTVYANAFYYPYGADPGRTFVDMVHHVQQKAGMQLADFRITSESPAQLVPNARCFHLEGTMDSRGGKGTQELNDIYCIGQEGRAGGWLSFVFGYTAPQAVAAKERATLGAIVQSFRMNQRVVNQQSAAIAGPSIANSMRIGQMVNARVQATHQAEDIHNSSVYQHWDSNDRRSQEFGNYQLGYAVVADNGNNAHGTLWADDAAALVKSNPNQFEYVSAPNYWKGIDY
jgi:hypothetical protein